MKSSCGNGKYDAANHIEHIKQLAGLQAQLRDHQRHLHYQAGDVLDDCLVTLANGHDLITNPMIEELRGIVGNGKYDAANHVEHIKQVARLQAQLRDHQRHLHYQAGDTLDNCLVMLAKGHDQIMNP